MKTLGESIAKVCRVSHRMLIKRVTQISGRSFNQLRALQAIAEENIRTQAELAERLILDAPSVSRLVDRLEEEGLLKRCEGADRRCVRLEVTAAAQEPLELMHQAVAAHDADIRRCLSASERKTLEALLQKLDGGLREVNEEAYRGG